jgi:flagellar biosynthesis GTPase FlhF
MSDARQATADVFQFTPNENDFWMSPRFERDLRASHCPFLIILVGNARAGKSTRANQTVRHELTPDEPFVAETGGDPITMKFQYVGPLKFGDLARIHGIDLQVDSNPDIFVIDCEGLHSLGETTPVLKQATFALSQIASMTVLVMKDQVNFDNIESVRSLFVLSHAFSCTLPGFAIGTTIMMREIGVRVPRGQRLSFYEENRLRQEADVRQSEQILAALNQAHVTCSRETLLVLAQPRLSDQQDLYWKSMEDFLRFAATIASRRSAISGQSLIDLFNMTKPAIMQIADFSQPNIQFGTVLGNLVNQYLTTATCVTIQNVENQIGQYLTRLNSQTLRTGLDVQFLTDMIGRARRTFEIEAEKLLPRILEYLPNQTTQFQRELETRVRTSFNRSFVVRCVAVLLPDLERQIGEGMNREIDAEMNRLPVESVPSFSFTNLSTRYENTAQSRFCETVRQVHAEILSSPQLQTFISRLRNAIVNYVRSVETRRRQEHSAHVERLAQQARQRQEAEQQAELDRIARERAEEARRLDRERRERLRQEEEARVRRQAELARQREQQEAARRAREEQERQAELERERVRRQQEAALEQQRAAARHAQWLQQQQWEADQRRQREREAELQRQAEAARRAAEQVRYVHHYESGGGGGGCAVC